MKGKINRELSHAGHTIINNRVLPERGDDASPRVTLDGNDLYTEAFFNPGVDAQVDQIMREVQHMRNTGRLAPFVEGEPIGRIRPRVKRPKIKDADLIKQRNKWAEDRRKEMLALRKRNNRTIRELLKKEKLYGRSNGQA